MNKRYLVSIANLFLFIAALPFCVAANDIVYTARYYNGPGTPGKSSFQIYTINPDGSHRKQLTSGHNAEYLDPCWSPDGKLILFKQYDTATRNFSLWVMNADGTDKRHVLWLRDFPHVAWAPKSNSIQVTDDPDGDVTTITQTTYDLHGRKLQVIKVRDDRVLPASPDGKLRYDTEAGQFIDNATGKVVGATNSAGAVVAWLSNTSLASLVHNDQRSLNTLLVFTAAGKQIKKTIVTIDPISLHNHPDVPDGEWERLRTMQGLPGKLLASQNWHNSTVGTDIGLFVIDTKTAGMTFLAETQFLAWSPDHQFLCTAPGRDTANYEHRADGTWRTVWVAPLNIVSVPSGKLRCIQGGLVWVTGADWRRPVTKN